VVEGVQSLRLVDVVRQWLVHQLHQLLLHFLAETTERRG
jgi:hypothetical protein